MNEMEELQEFYKHETQHFGLVIVFSLSLSHTHTHTHTRTDAANRRDD